MDALQQLEARLQAAALERQANQLPRQDEAALRQQVSAEAIGLTRSQQHDAAIALLTKALHTFPQDPALRRQTAYAHGAKGEWGLGLIDRLGMTPRAEDVARFQAPLERAVETDPQVADPHWDLAVLKARFAHDYAAAAKHLADAQRLGYRHPKLPQLAQIIEQGLQRGAPPRDSGADSAAQRLKQIVWDLVQWPRPHVAVGLDAASAGVSPFAASCEAAAQLVRGGGLDVAVFDAVRAVVARALEGDAAETAADLLRRTATEFGDAGVIAAATHAHLQVLVQMSFALRGRVPEGAHWLVRARRAALRGLAIVDAAAFAIDPDLHADLLLALGQTYGHPSAYQLPEATRHYLRALELKEAAGNTADVLRLRELLRKMIVHGEQQWHAAAIGMGAAGSALADLEAGFDASRRCGDAALTARIGIVLAGAYSAVHQPLAGERVLEDVLQLPALPDALRVEARFQLASALSESGRAQAALDIHDELLAEPALATTAVFWMNLGNSRRATGRIEAAREAFVKALGLLPVPQVDELPVQRGHIQSLLGEVEFLLGRPREGAAWLRRAERAFGELPSMQALRFRMLAGALFFEAGQIRRSQQHLDRARQLLRWQLSRGASLPVWESMLQAFSRPDAYDVEALMAGKAVQRREALLRAESAKGRLLAWLRNRAAPEAAAAALSDERQADALAAVETWVGGAAGRTVLSLFAAERGLAVFALSHRRLLAGHWIDDFRYQSFADDCIGPWEDIVSRAMDGDAGAFPLAGLLTEHLLERIGEWLWRAVPALAKGGEELIIVPHRVFRSLPLAHCRLPGGRALSELFQRVSTSASMFDLALALRSPRPVRGQLPITALVDPDGSLPFARLEGLCAAGPAHTAAGAAARADALRGAIASPGIVLVSAHGDFHEDNPWLSLIHASDAPLELLHLVGDTTAVHAQVVVLGVCEAGRTRRSASDEPLGFASVLAQGGASAVVAALWRVDDFASLFFVSRLFEHLHEQTSAARAVALSARWLRQLSAKDALVHFDGLSQNLRHTQHPLALAALHRVEDKMRRNRDWLAQMPAGAAPFRSPLDWAAFQVVGSPS